MSETPASKPDRDDRIIDAEVEPIGKAGRSRSIWRIVVLLGAAIVVSIVVAAAWHLYSTGRLGALVASREEEAPAAPAPQPAPVAGQAAEPRAANDEAMQRIDDLERRLGSLTASLERLQQLPAAPTADEQRLNELAMQVQDMAAARTDLEQKLERLTQANENQTTQRAALQQQINLLQTQMAALSEGRQAAIREPLVQLLAWGELRDRARRGENFTAEMAVLSAYAEREGGPLQQAFTAVQSFEQVPPSAMQLAARFSPLAEAHRAAPPAQAGTADAPAQSWWQRSLDRITGLISIRKAGSVDTGSPEGRLAVAERALQQQDLAAAQAALDGLELTPGLAEWKQQAADRIRLEAALDSYGTALRAHLAASR